MAVQVRTRIFISSKIKLFESSQKKRHKCSLGADHEREDIKVAIKMKTKLSMLEAGMILVSIYLSLCCKKKNDCLSLKTSQKH